ncbi:MAG: large conductance mechanosensitive channel protein MscL [Candidatus Nomurabacteria bacterium]|nr:large conductance mechanosensitive channel protein MscL [Candidatus Nomurabacteria bacterium]
MKILKEFKEFAVKGNMVDMTVGIVIGAAFGTVVKSLVDDIIMPLIAGAFGSPDFSNLFAVLRKPEIMDGVDMTSIAAVREAGGVALGYGLFINALIAFLLVSWALFVVVKIINRIKRKEEQKPEKEQKVTEDIKLLREIRDNLKGKSE